MILNTSFTERKLGPASSYTEVMWIGVKTSGILKNCVQCGRKILALPLWWSAWGLYEKFSADESNSDKTLAAMSLLSL